MDERFSRQMALFGNEGQDRIRSTKVTVVGVGGLGIQLVQQLVFLGVRSFSLVEPEELEITNRNRFVGSRWDDPIPGTGKLEIAERLIWSVEPGAEVQRIEAGLVTERAFQAVKEADVVFGCLDKEGPRLILNELCSAYERRYIDLASDVIPGDPPEWGGRVCINWDSAGCIVCHGEFDPREAGRQIAGAEGEEIHRAIYGVSEDLLSGGGPSVISINGVITSLATTEFVAGVTGLRPPIPVLTYRGWQGVVLKRITPETDCYYCEVVRGQREEADVERFLRGGVGAYL